MVGVPVNAVGFVEADGEVVDGVFVRSPSVQSGGVAGVVSGLRAAPVVVGSCVRLPEAVLGLRLLEAGVAVVRRGAVFDREISGGILDRKTLAVVPLEGVAIKKNVAGAALRP